MIETNLKHLELQVDHLLQTREHLRLENHSLRNKLAKTTRERAQVAEKNQQASTKIKRILSQLRSEIL